MENSITHFESEAKRGACHKSQHSQHLTGVIGDESTAHQIVPK